MNLNRVFSFGVLFFILLTTSSLSQVAQEDYIEYIQNQKQFFAEIVKQINNFNESDFVRDNDFNACPEGKISDDLLGYDYKPIHTEQAGFLDCDGPTFLNIYKNGLYTNNTGFTEYKCYLHNFKMEKSGISSGMLKNEVLEHTGIPILQTKNMIIFGCTLDQDPFADMEEDYEEQDRTDPYNYALDMYFIFENNRLTAVVRIHEYACY